MMKAIIFDIDGVIFNSHDEDGEFLAGISNKI